MILLQYARDNLSRTTDEEEIPATGRRKVDVPTESAGLSVRQRGKRAANTEDGFSAYSTNSSICRVRVYKKRYLYGERKA